MKSARTKGEAGWVRRVSSMSAVISPPHPPFGHLLPPQGGEGKMGAEVDGQIPMFVILSEAKNLKRSERSKDRSYV